MRAGYHCCRVESSIFARTSSGGCHCRIAPWHRDFVFNTFRGTPTMLSTMVGSQYFFPKFCTEVSFHVLILVGRGQRSVRRGSDFEDQLRRKDQRSERCFKKSKGSSWALCFGNWGSFQGADQKIERVENG